MSSWKRWTDEEVEYLRNNYLTMRYEDISRNLGIIPHKVSYKIQSLGLKKLRSWTKEEVINELKKRYEEGNRLFANDDSALFHATIKYFMSWNKAKIKLGIELNHIYILPEMAKVNCKELFYVIGVILGDGHISKNKYGNYAFVVLNTIDKDFALEFKKNMEKWSGKRCDRIKLREKKDIKSPDTGKYYKCNPQYNIQLSSVEVSSFLHKKIKNLDITMATKEEKCFFLRGLFDSECTVGKHPNRMIRIGMKSENIIKLIMKLLTELGIENHLRYRKIKSGTYFMIEMHKKEPIIKFNDEIGISIGRKQERLNEIVGKYNG